MSERVRVSVVVAEERQAAVSQAIELLGNQRPCLSGKSTVLKPNFNSADPFPAGTHNETLRALLRYLQDAGATDITAAERSGIAWDSYEVAAQKGLPELFAAFRASHVILDDLTEDEWVHVAIEDGHWLRGIEIPRLIQRAEAIVMTCCLKTHAYGGHFTMSLKNSVGLVPLKSLTDGYDYMSELHQSPHQRKMIAEINTAFDTDLVVLDATSAFITGGPFEGDVVNPGVMLASKDRVAIDAVGVAILRCYETTADVKNGSIFEQEQIQHAARLGVGVAGPNDIELVSDSSDESERWVERILEQLSA